MKSFIGKRKAATKAAILAMTIAGSMFAIPAVQAQEATKLGTFKQWTAWKSTDASGVICFISSDPQKMQPANVDHGDVHFLVIHRKGIGAKNEVQSLMGYQLRKDPAPIATIDGKGVNSCRLNATKAGALADDLPPPPDLAPFGFAPNGTTLNGSGP